MVTTLGTGIGVIFILIVALLVLALPIFATIRVANNRSGVELVLWLLFIWLVGFIGPIVALCVVRPNRRS